VLNAVIGIYFKMGNAIDFKINVRPIILKAAFLVTLLIIFQVDSAIQVILYARNPTAKDYVTLAISNIST